MFDIGFWELATIAIIGIVIVGPNRLPEVVRTIMIIIRKIRRAFNSVKTDIERELDLDNLRQQMDDLDMENHIKKLNQSVMDMDKQMHDGMSQLNHDIHHAIHDDTNIMPPDEYADTGEEHQSTEQAPQIDENNQTPPTEIKEN